MANLFDKWALALQFNIRSHFHTLTLDTPNDILHCICILAGVYKNAYAVSILLCAIVNRDLARPETIFSKYIDWMHENPVYTELYVQVADTMLTLAHGPRGPYMLDDLEDVRLRKRKGPLYQALQKRAYKRWSTIFFAVILKCMWRSWIHHILRPESGFIRRVVSKRFYDSIKETYSLK